MKKHHFNGVVVRIERIDRGRDRELRYHIVYETEQYPNLILGCYTAMDIVMPEGDEK